MPQINCHIPIKLRLVGTLTETQLEQLSETLVRSVSARLAFAERTIFQGQRVSGEWTIEEAREYPQASRWQEGDYEVPAYDRHGNRQRLPVQASTATSETRETKRELPLFSDFHDYAFFFAGGSYGQAAEAYIKEFYPEHHRFQARSFEQMFHLLLADIRRRRQRSGRRVYVSEIVIVTHANAAGGMKIPLTQDNRKRTFTPWDLTELQREFRHGLHRNFRTERREVVEALDENTRIVVRGCNFGQSQEALDALRAFFGGDPIVFAPTGYQGFEVLQVGGSLLKTPEQAFDFLVQQGYLPPDQKELSVEEKRRYIRNVFGEHARIPAEFFIMSRDDYDSFKKLPTSQRLGPAAEGFIRRPFEENEPETGSNIPSGGKFWGLSAPPIFGRDPELDVLSIEEIVERARELRNPYRPQNAAMLQRLMRAWERKSLSSTPGEAGDDPLAGLPPFEIFGDPNILAMDAALYPAEAPRHDIFEEETLTFQAPTKVEERAQATQFEEVERVFEEAASAGLPEVREGSFSSRGQVETLPDGIRLWNFAVARARLRREFQAPLQEIAQRALADPNLHIKIEGHTSSSGSERSNDRLSQQRAEAVKEFLVHAGVPATQIETQGHGEHNLLERQERRRGQIIPHNMARNRRVEVRLERITPPPVKQTPPAPAPVYVSRTFTKFRIRMIAGGELGEVVGGGVITFELEELGPGGRSAYFTFEGLGAIAGPLPGGAFGLSSWTEFTTSVPMVLENFEGGGRIALVGVSAIGGYGYSVLVFYCGDLPTQTAQGWGWGTGLGAGASWYHGYWERRR